MESHEQRERERKRGSGRERENTDWVIHGLLTLRAWTEQGSLQQLNPIMDFKSRGAGGEAALRLEAADFGPLPCLWPPLLL